MPPKAQPAAAQQQDPLYVCAVCLREQVLKKESYLMCIYCAHETGTSKVFFKKRTEATTYEAR